MPVEQVITLYNIDGLELDNGPEVIVPFAQDKFDASGNLIDQNTKKFLQQLLQNLANWTRILK